MRRTWTEVADTLRTLRQRFAALPSPAREERINAIDETTRALAKCFARRSARFNKQRFFEIVGLRLG
jgi:hypothetical protein